MQYATPAPDGNGEVRAGWPVTNTLGVPGAWVSGYYLARIVLSDGSVPGAIPFVVREPAAAPAPSAVVVQVPVNTWQAYNAWGGKSLYDFNSGGSRANRVSFDRPYLWIGPGAQVMTSWELSLVRFLESEGVDVSYVTDVDVDRDPAVLTRHRVAITAGHGEYWTKGVRDAFESARGAGTNLLFMGANTGYWQVRYENGRRTMVGYKSAADPEATLALKTMLFRDVGRPECALLGVQHYEGSYNWPRADFVTNPYPVGSQWFQNTGLVAGADDPADRESRARHDSAGYELWAAADCAVPLRPGQRPARTRRGRALHLPGLGRARVLERLARVLLGAQLLPPGGDGASTQVHPGVQQLVRNVLANAQRPAPPASLTTEVVSGRKLRIRIGVRGDPRIARHRVYRRAGGTAPPLTSPGWTQVCMPPTASSCLNTVPAAGVYRFAVIAVDRWGQSAATYSGRRTVP